MEHMWEAYRAGKGLVEDYQSLAVDGRSIVGNPHNGDVVFVGLNIEEEVITRCRWQVDGSQEGGVLWASMVEHIEGSSLDRVLGWRVEEVLALLGIEESGWRGHVETMLQGLLGAVSYYFARTGQSARIPREERVLLCACADVSEWDLRQNYLRGNHRLSDLQKATGAGLACDLCHERLFAYHEALEKEFPMNGNVHIRH